MIDERSLILNEHSSIILDISKLSYLQNIIFYIDLKSLSTYRGCRLGSTKVELAPKLAIWVSMARLLERVTSQQKAAALIPVWG